MWKFGKRLKLSAPFENRAEQLTFQWPPFRISSTDSTIRNTLHSVSNSTTGALIWMGTLYDSFQRFKTWNHLVQHNKHYYRKVLLNSFHLNGYTLEFHPQTQNSSWLIRRDKQHLRQLLFNSFRLNSNLLSQTLPCIMDRFKSRWVGLQMQIHDSGFGSI